VSQLISPSSTARPDARRTAGAPVVAAHRLTKRYGRITALQDVDFTVGRGEVVAVLGPNGSGKTTLIECLTLQQQPTDGTVELFGRDGARDLRREDRARIGVVLQDSRTDSDLTVREHLAMIAGYYGVPDDALDPRLRRVGLEDVADRRVHRLSGGQRRKLELAIATVSDPELVYLDEPTTGLDIETREALWTLVRDARDDGAAIVLTTHYLEEAEALADRVCIVVDGRIVHTGTVADVAAAAGLDPDEGRLADAYTTLLDRARGTTAATDPEATPTPTRTR